jgi:hypothetical protein
MKTAIVAPYRQGARLRFHERRSDSPFIERVWTSHSEPAGCFVSVAASNVETAITRHQGKVFLTIRGPETKATLADCPADGEWLGIRFALGTYLPSLLPATIADQKDMTIPGPQTRDSSVSVPGAGKGGALVERPPPVDSGKSPVQ